MITVLCRDARCSVRRCWGRFALVALGALLIAGAWRIGRPALVDWCALRSLGFNHRQPLIAAVLCRRYPQDPPAAAANDRTCVWSFRTLHGAGADWCATGKPQVVHFADAKLWRLAHLTFTPDEDLFREVGFPPALRESPLLDFDGDGRREGLFRLLADLDRWAVVRFDGECPCLLLVFGWHGRDQANIFAFPQVHWDNESKTSPYRLKVSCSYHSLPKGKLTRGPETVLSSQWNHAGGLLLPETDPGADFKIWIPPDGNPLPFPLDTPLDELCSELLIYPNAAAVGPPIWRTPAPQDPQRDLLLHRAPETDGPAGPSTAR